MPKKHQKKYPNLVLRVAKTGGLDQDHFPFVWTTAGHRYDIKWLKDGKIFRAFKANTEPRSLLSDGAISSLKESLFDPLSNQPISEVEILVHNPTLNTWTPYEGQSAISNQLSAKAAAKSKRDETMAYEERVRITGKHPDGYQWEQYYHRSKEVSVDEFYTALLEFEKYREIRELNIMSDERREKNGVNFHTRRMLEILRRTDLAGIGVLFIELEQDMDLILNYGNLTLEQRSQLQRIKKNLAECMQISREHTD